MAPLVVSLHTYTRRYVTALYAYVLILNVKLIYSIEITLITKINGIIVLTPSEVVLFHTIIQYCKYANKK